MKEKILLIDGHELLFRMFFGIPSRIKGRNGQLVHGIVGFLGSVIKAASIIKPNYLLVVFDSELGSFRQNKKSDYKENRQRDWAGVDDDANPFSQLSGICQSLDHLGWRHCEVLDVEADDVIAAYVRKYKKEYKVIIISHDTDLLQLVGSNVSVFHPKGKKSIMLTPTEVEKKFGVKPILIPELKSLMGDKTDNINGIPGVGLKTAQQLLLRFGGINNIYQKISEVESEKLKNKLIDYKTVVEENLSLIKLDHDIDLPFKLSSIRIDSNSWEIKTMQIMKDVGLV